MPVRTSTLNKTSTPKSNPPKKEVSKGEKTPLKKEAPPTVVPLKTSGAALNMKAFDASLQFSFGDLIAIGKPLGLNQTTLRSWYVRKLLPSVLKTQTGKHTVYNLETVVGIAVAAVLRNTPRSCSVTYASSVIQAFSKVPFATLVKTLNTKGKGLLTVQEGKLIFGKPERESVNVSQIISELKISIEQYRNQTRKTRKGRKTQLLATTNGVVA